MKSLWYATKARSLSEVHRWSKLLQACKSQQKNWAVPTFIVESQVSPITTPKTRQKHLGSFATSSGPFRHRATKSSKSLHEMIRITTRERFTRLSPKIFERYTMFVK